MFKIRNCGTQLHNTLLSEEVHTTGCQQVQKDLTNLQHLNTKENLINAYPDRFEGIGHFPGTYHITLQNDAKAVVHAP